MLQGWPTVDIFILVDMIKDNVQPVQGGKMSLAFVIGLDNVLKSASKCIWGFTLPVFFAERTDATSQAYRRAADPLAEL